MPESADAERELDEIADELYALRPDAFATARDEEVRKARAERRQPLARALAQLRRPSQSAWLINLLWRHQRDLMEQLLQLAADLSRAQAEASGPDLHRLTARRRELEAALVRGARALGEKAGVNVTAAMERETQETLAAALARTDVADEVRTGRLVKPASYAGFGTLLPPSAPPFAARPAGADDAAPQLLHAPRPPRPDDRPAGPADRPAGTQERAAGTADRAAGAADRAASAADRAAGADERAAGVAERVRERRVEAERRVEEARAAVEAAAETLAAQGQAVEAAQERRQTVRAQVDQVQEQLREVQQRLAGAEQAEAAAVRLREQVTRGHAAAKRTLARAEQQLNEVRADG